MAKHKYTVGEKEKHNITVNWSILSKHLTIEIDGEKMVDKFHYSPAPEKFEYELGGSEKHLVEISAGGFSAVKLFVNGEELQQN